MGPPHLEVEIHGQQHSYNNLMVDKDTLEQQPEGKRLGRGALCPCLDQIERGANRQGDKDARRLNSLFSQKSELENATINLQGKSSPRKQSGPMGASWGGGNTGAEVYPCLNQILDKFPSTTV